MKSMFVFMIIILAFVLSGLLIYLFCRFAKIYRTLPSGERIFIGYLWKWSRSYIVYDGIPFLGADRIGFIDVHKHIYLMTENVQHNFVEVNYGSVDDMGKCTDINNNTVAQCDSIGNDGRSTCVNDIHQNEIAFVKTGYRKGDDLLIRAAAVGALCMLNSDQDSSLRADVRIGFKDLALPASLIFMLFFVPMALLGYNVEIMDFLGSEISYVSYMMLLYAFICWVLYFIKKCMTMRNMSITYFLGLVDRNVGVKGWNVIIIVFAVALFLTTIFGVNYTLAPLFLVIATGFLVNTRCFKDDWVVVDPCATWGTKWGRVSKVVTNNIQVAQGTICKTYSWTGILDARGIKHNNEEVVLYFTKMDYDGDGSRVRAKNPFANTTDLTEEDLKKYSNEVLVGCDDANNEERNAIVAIINSAYQLCQKYNLADFELYDLLLKFCQYNIEYIEDEKSDSIGNAKEYFRYAAETLYDGQGDCDCKSILAYKIFQALNVNVELALMKTNKSDKYNHVALVLHKDSAAMVPIPNTYKEYSRGLVFCETTEFGHEIGDVPYEVDQSSIYFVKK